MHLLLFFLVLSIPGASVFLGAFCFTCILARALGWFFLEGTLGFSFQYCSVIIHQAKHQLCKHFVSSHLPTCVHPCGNKCAVISSPYLLDRILNTLFQWLFLSHLNQLLILGTIILWGPRQKTTLVLGVL